MLRAERLLFPAAARRRPGGRLRRLSLALGTAFPLCVAAQAPQSLTAPGDARYTPPTAGVPGLYPRTEDDAQASSVYSAGRYAANEAVGKIVVEADRNAVPADGRSAVKLKIRLYGRDGQPMKTPAFVTIEHSGGRILLAGARTDELGPRRQDADRSAPGVQIDVAHGEAEVTLLAPFEAQDVKLRVTAGAEEAAGVISFVPEMREQIAAGLVEGVINFRRHGGNVIEPVQSGSGGFDQEIQAWSRQFEGGKANLSARTAFYLKGTVSGAYLLTAAYDSDKETRTRLLRDVQPEEMYPVYGDASLRTFDARSADRLYVRVDKDKNYALYGDFVTGDGFSQPIGQGAVASLKQRSLGNYNRTATGVRLHREEDGLTGNVFFFNDSLHQVVEEFASQGSGPYGLSNNAAVEGSDEVEVIVRDRAQPSRILSVRPLQRLTDYTFEPFSGRILLSSFLPAFDENLNPVSLRVTYEVDQGGERFWVAGGDVQYRINPLLEIGGSAVTDRNPLSPFEMQSANATLRLGPNTALTAEVAHTTSTVNTNPANQTVTPGLAGRIGEVQGDAWRVELAHEDDTNDVHVFVGRAAPEFNNPAAPLNGGRAEGSAKATRKITDTVTAYGEYLSSDDLTEGGGKRQSGAAGFKWKATDRLTLDAGLSSQRETIGTQGNGTLTAPFGSTAGLTSSIGSGSGGGALGFGNQSIDPATGLPIVTQTDLANAITDLPAGTKLSSDSARLGAGYRLTDRFTLGGEVEQDISGDARRRESLGGDYQLTERSKLYARYEHQSGWVDTSGVTTTGRTANAFVFGVNSTFMKDIQAFSEYRLRDAISDRDLEIASGVRTGWTLADGLRLSTGYERISVISGQTAPADATTLGLDYTGSSLWKASAKVELRRSGDIEGTPDNEKFDTVLWQAMVARKLDRDWTLLARDYLLTTRYATRGDVVQDDATLGVAYRDTDTNRVNALMKLEHKLERDGSNAAVGELATKAWIASTIGDWHPSRPWWLTGRVAVKWQADRLEGGVRDDFKALLVSGRGVYDVTENWDLGALVATQLGQLGARQKAYGAEVGYLVRQNLWLSVGVNVSGFSGDADLSGYEYTQRGAYLRLRFKFDETLWRGGDPNINRTLDR